MPADILRTEGSADPVTGSCWKIHPWL